MDNQPDCGQRVLCAYIDVKYYSLYAAFKPPVVSMLVVSACCALWGWNNALRAQQRLILCELAIFTLSALSVFASPRRQLSSVSSGVG